jgi:hypothetical protein
MPVSSMSNTFRSDQASQSRLLARGGHVVVVSRRTEDDRFTTASQARPTAA